MLVYLTVPWALGGGGLTESTNRRPLPGNEIENHTLRNWLLTGSYGRQRTQANKIQ